MKHLFLAAIAVVVVLSGAHAGAQSGYDLFQKALATERADGNLREAIQMYERVVKQFASDRALVARALIRIAECQEKLGQRDAAKVYERIIREFADQAESVGVARARLTALQSPIPPAVQAVRKIWSGGAVDAMGAPSADGRFLSFTNWTTGDLGLRDLAEGTNRMLTNTGGWEASGDYAESSVLSLDARQIAYAWFTDKGGDPAAKCACRYDLRVMSTAGDDPRKARTVLRGETEDSWFQPIAFTADGKGLLVLQAQIRQRNEIAMLTLADNSVRVLKSLGATFPERLSLSPDGRFITFDVPPTADAARDIVMMDVVSRQEIVAAPNPAHDYSPMFSLDGSHLLFLSDRTGTAALWRLPLAAGRPAGPAVQVLSIGAHSNILGVTRHGSLIYWTGGPGSNIYTVDLDDTLSPRGEPQLAIDRFLNANAAPAFSPNGELLAYHSRRGASRNNEGTLVIHSLATKQDRDVPLRDHPSVHVSWFPDSRSVLIPVRDPQQGRIHYYRADVSTGEQQLLMSTHAAGIPMARPQVSPDGKAIYFVDRVGTVTRGPWTLGRYDIATRQITELLSVANDQSLTSFQISSDGTQIAYLRSDNAGRQSILEVTPSAGGSSRELSRHRDTGPARYSGLAWSRDDKFIFSVRENQLAAADGPPGGSLWKIPVGGGAAAPTGIALPGMIRIPNLDPTGRKLVFAVAGGGEPAIWAVENFLPRK